MFNTFLVHIVFAVIAREDTAFANVPHITTARTQVTSPRLAVSRNLFNDKLVLILDLNWLFE